MSSSVLEQQEAYTALKPAWHTDRIQSLRHGEQIVPAQVQIIISDLCNQDCSFCAYRISNGFSNEQFGEDTGRGFTNNPNRKIPTEKVMEILRDCKGLGVEAIQFTGGGEPTVHPDHLVIFQHALDLGFKCGLVSNGFKLKTGWEDVLSRFSWLRVSIDADNAETYSRIRRTRKDAYYTVLENVRRMRAVIGGDTLLGCGYVITPDNWEGLVGGAARIRDAGASYVRFSAMFSKDFHEPYLPVYDAIRERIEEAKTLATDDFQVVDLFGSRVEDLTIHSPDYDFCGYQQFNMYVGGNQKVYRCCTTAYTRHGEVGDLTNQSFAEWFHSDEKKRAYDDFNAHSCFACPYNSKNRVIDYLVSGKPTHVEFV